MKISGMIPIETDRLLLDKFNGNDRDNYYRIHVSPEQHRFNFETYNPKSGEQIRDYLEELCNQNYDELETPFVLAIRLKNGRLIGFIGFKNGTLKEKGHIEVYYSIYKDYWNNGYGSEALIAFIHFGFDIIKLHRIFAGCDIDNYASKRVLEKAGMRFESYWRKDRIRNGKYTDGLGFAILEEDLIGR